MYRLISVKLRKNGTNFTPVYKVIERGTYVFNVIECKGYLIREDCGNIVCPVYALNKLVGFIDA